MKHTKITSEGWNGRGGICLFNEENAHIATIERFGCEHTSEQHTRAKEFIKVWNCHDDLLKACKSITGLIGNVDHSTGNGENSARTRGHMLNDIGDMAKAAIAKAK